MKVDPVIVITHAAFDEGRRQALARLEEQLKSESLIRYFVIRDEERRGSLWCWYQAMKKGLDTDATHIVWLADDHVLCGGFQAALLRAIAARPDDVFDCFINHGAPKADPGGWYSTHDGYVGGAGVMPRALLEQHLEWRALNLDTSVANDLGVNMWAMATSRLLWKTAVSLLDQDTTIASLEGNDGHHWRHPNNLVSDASDIVWRPASDAWPHLGRTYIGNHWELVFRTRPESWDLEAVYRAERNGHPVSDRPHVLIATPAYQPPELAYLSSVAAVVEDLRTHGIEVTHFITGGDSLVTRGRHMLLHTFLCSSATHLLQWDADIECLDVTAVRRMVESGRPVVGGAYPFRDGSGGVVANLLEADRNEQRVDVRPDGTIPVSEVGTGFMLTRRDVIIDMQKRHPELLYEADMEGVRGAPMWALFDVAIEPMPNGRKRYASEDWRFCSLARAAGHEVSIYYPPQFRHWGKVGHTGHVTKAWGMKTEAA